MLHWAACERLLSEQQEPPQLAAEMGAHVGHPQRTDNPGEFGDDGDQKA
jgi:hypothetical protein